ncbi:hypothetical protein PS9374_06413 [Planomonospora sphaerica]|uniref:Uncharacterized protein n=1 Tax=Planomonospora sphaerica TaxID=161355 RepID=A0A161LN42_9ACTN|nr:hypothetical protein PS9374_06413 [Planomonospora sphaerica]
MAATWRTCADGNRHRPALRPCTLSALKVSTNRIEAHRKTSGKTGK